MEYKNIYLAIFGFVGLIFWLIDFFHLFQKAQIVIPNHFRRGKKYFFRFFVLVVGIAAWLMISYALTFPRLPLGFSKSTIEVNDIFIVVDISSSMLGEDFNPNRMEAAKQKILEFVELRPTDRIGLIIFSGKAYTLLPLTIDLELIKKMVPEIRVNYPGVGQGTNIGDAIGLAVARGAFSMAKNKIIILLTDGASNVGTMTPTEAAEKAAENNIKIYSIGIGGDPNAQMPIGVDGLGRKTYQNIPGGSFDFKNLQMISNLTGGRAYAAKDSKALKTVLMEIEKIEKTKIESTGQKIYKELYFIYLLYGLLMLIGIEFFRYLVLREVR